MNKVFFLFIFLGLSCANVSLSQGYKDKRFSTSYEYGYSMLGRFFTFDRFVLSRHTLDASYTLSRRLSVGLRFNYAKKTLPADILVGTLGNDKIFTLYGGTNDGTFRSAMIEDLSFGISLRYFAKSNGCYAPIGKYFALGYERGSQNSTRLVEEIYSGSSNPDRIYVYDRAVKETLQVFSVTYGRNILIYDKILVGYGLTMSFNQNRFQQFRRFMGRPFINVGILF